MHDVTYNYGFDEASGNFQVNTYGHGGVGNDDVRAEAQDGSGTQQRQLRHRRRRRPAAHADVRLDARRFPNFVTVNCAVGASPATTSASVAGFGRRLATTGPISRHRGRWSTTARERRRRDGCEPFVGCPAGDDRADRPRRLHVRGQGEERPERRRQRRSSWPTTSPATPITMGGADPTITIPSVMISLDDANLFKANLPVDATWPTAPAASLDRDSDLDNGVIAHEYGHGISNRLTGGPAVVNCLNNAEQMGEGWSDWFALDVDHPPVRHRDHAAWDRHLRDLPADRPASASARRSTPPTWASTRPPTLRWPTS